MKFDNLSKLVGDKGNLKVYNQSSMVEMALEWSATLRIFEKGSKGKIQKIIEEMLAPLSSVKTQETFNSLHKETCKKIIKEINLNKKLRKRRRKVSFGEAAKIVDMSLKVYVYLCKMPDTHTSVRLVNFLNCPIDNNNLEWLKKHAKEGRDAFEEINSLADIHEIEYYNVQRALRETPAYQKHQMSLPDIDEILIHSY